MKKNFISVLFVMTTVSGSSVTRFVFDGRNFHQEVPKADLIIQQPPLPLSRDGAPSSVEFSTAIGASEGSGAQNGNKDAEEEQTRTGERRYNEYVLYPFACFPCCPRNQSCPLVFRDQTRALQCGCILCAASVVMYNMMCCCLCDEQD